VTELSPPVLLPPDTLLLHFEDGTCEIRNLDLDLQIPSPSPSRSPDPRYP
jgi:hypothetical protein